MVMRLTSAERKLYSAVTDYLNDVVYKKYDTVEIAERDINEQLAEWIHQWISDIEEQFGRRHECCHQAHPARFAG